MTHASKARLFVAIDLPAPVRDALASWARVATAGLRGRGDSPPRLLARDSLHVTLCFLGSLPTEEIEPIGEAVCACVGVVGELTLGAPLWLPPRRPRTLAVEIHDNEEGSLGALHEGVRGVLAGVGVAEANPRDPGASARGRRRRFRPHVTVARMREGAAPHERTLAEPTPSLAFSPEALVLYRSWLDPDGARYEAMARRSLLAP